MSYFKLLKDLSNNDLNKFTVNGKQITIKQLDSLLNKLIRSSRVELALTELSKKGKTDLSFISPDLKFIPMTIKLIKIKGEDVNGKK